MKVHGFNNYSKLYEARLAKCEFFTEQNITVDDIINPIEDLITEEFIDSLIQGAKKVGQWISNAVTGIVNFFKNFSLKKMIGAISNKIKEIGSKTWNRIKEALSGFKEFIVANGLADENNRPNFQKIWAVLCQKAKSIVNWQEAGVTPDKLQSVGAQVKINEGDSKYEIGDDEVKYYGFFEKVAHALGIKNARFNGVVSQIMKKTTIGLIIIGILKVAGISLAGLTLGLSPVAMAAIGGMLLMAGLIILAIWVCKPYPTVDDCLAYLHMAFGGNLNQNGMTNIFIQDIDITYIENTTIDITVNVDSDEESNVTVITPQEVEDAKPISSMYPTMIKNLQALKGMIGSIDGISLEGESSSGEENKKNNIAKYFDPKNKWVFIDQKGNEKNIKILRTIKDKKGILIPNVFQVEDEQGKKFEAPVKNIKLKNSGDIEDAEILDTKPDIQKRYRELINNWKIEQKKLGKNTKPGEGTRKRLLRQAENVRESILPFSIFEKEFSKEFSKQPRNVEVTGAEDHVTQAVKNIRTSLKNIKDEKDKGIGITDEFISSILDKKMDTEAKNSIKSLYEEVYEHLYGKYSKTMPDFGPLYKESIEIISDKNKRKLTAEKIARLAKRSLQFEGENMYASLGEFGADMRDFNTTLKEIMASFKAEGVKESHVFSFEKYNNK